MADWKNRIISLGQESPEQLLANPHNWRVHNGAQRNALRGSLNTVGWVGTILVNKRTGFVIDGHARIEEAITRHEKTVPVLYVDLSPEEEAQVLATLDPISAMATHDQEALDELLADLHVDDAGLQALLDSLGSQEAPKKDEPAGGGPSDEITCPACGTTFPIGVRVKPTAGGPKGNEIDGGN